MSDKDPQFTDEMVSAYLDGELSDTEREYVERIVESDPQYRRMLEELQALRDRLKSLPRLQLDDAFHQRVLDRAVERSQPSPARSTQIEGQQVWRRLAWVAGTIAAAVLLMLFLPDVINRLGPGPVDELGQVPNAARDEQQLGSKENQKEENQEDSQGMVSSPLRQNESELPDAPMDHRSRPAENEAVRQPAPEQLAEDGIKSRGVGSLPRENAPTSDEDGIADRAGPIDQPFADRVEADDLATSLAQIDFDLDAIVYCGKLANGTSKALAVRGLHRIRSDSDESVFSRRSRDYGLEGQPHLMLVNGSPEQVGLSLSRIELGDAPEAVDLALTESSTDKFEDGSLGRGRPKATAADRYSRKDDQDRLRRSSDLYIDLDAADSEPVVVDHVTKESDEYQKLLGFLAVKSAAAAPSEAKVADGSEANAVRTLRSARAEPEAVTNLNKPTVSPEDRAAVAESKATVTSSDLAGSRTALPSLAQDQSDVLFYSLVPSQNRQTARHYVRQMNADAVVDHRAIVEELKSISPKNRDGTLRVLLVLPATEVAATPVPQPAGAVEPAATDEDR